MCNKIPIVIGLGLYNNKKNKGEASYICEVKDNRIYKINPTYTKHYIFLVKEN